VFCDSPQRSARGGRAALRNDNQLADKETNHMNKTVSVQSDAAFNSVMADLGLDFALSPIHRIGFDLDERGIQLLAEHYYDRVFRARQWSAQEKLTWQTLLLRFDEGVYVLALGDGRNCGESSLPAPKRPSRIIASYTRC
jgi:hypothetical protein